MKVLKILILQCILLCHSIKLKNTTIEDPPIKCQYVNSQKIQSDHRTDSDPIGFYLISVKPMKFS